MIFSVFNVFNVFKSFYARYSYWYQRAVESIQLRLATHSTTFSDPFNYV